MADRQQEIDISCQFGCDWLEATCLELERRAGVGVVTRGAVVEYTGTGWLATLPASHLVQFAGSANGRHQK